MVTKSTRLRRRKILGLGVTATLVFSVMLAGCGDKKNTQGNENSSSQPSQPSQSTQPPQSASAADDLKPVELKYYVAVAPQKDWSEVNAKINEITKAKINATVKLINIPFGDWTQKMNVFMASGEAFDLAFTCPWLGPTYYDAVAKGAFLPLDDLLTQYAPKLKALVPDIAWDATRVNGKIYGAINYQIMAMPYGVLIDQSLMTKYNFDLAKVTKIADLEPLLEAAKNGGDIKQGISPEQPTSAPPVLGYDSIGTQMDPGWVKLTDPSLKVVNQYETQEFKDILTLYHNWFKKGYIRNDILTAAANFQNDFDNGKYIGKSVIPGGLNGDVTASAMSKVGQKFKMQPLITPLITTDRAIATMTAISRTSKNPERAMMFLELLNTDPELYNTLAFGIEGKHWVKTGDKQIDYGPGLDANTTGYAPNVSWEFGRQALAYYWPGETVGIWDQAEEMNATADHSPLLGFNFDPTPVKSEIAKISSVTTELLVPLMTGALDPEVYLPQFLDKLKNAGADHVIAEKQKQLDAWKASNKG
ncbi:ABC transporter substrate-binding protein [Cohnella soli]|uniref:ABC transporter substrate-binding protein n=1 Tax=Cohnella soli TaxID=425005 RepID=A0ABW0HVT6_9BACL